MCSSPVSNTNYGYPQGHGSSCEEPVANTVVAHSEDQNDEAKIHDEIGEIDQSFTDILVLQFIVECKYYSQRDVGDSDFNREFQHVR